MLGGPHTLPIHKDGDALRKHLAVLSQRSVILKTDITQDTLQGFNEAIHELFPKIVDTKYLATHAEGDLNASPTLQEIAEGLANQPLPSIVTDPDHSKYQDTEAFHEAGYDSLLTATIMIRLAAKIGAQREKEAKPAPNRKAIDAEATDFVRDGREKVTKPVPLPPVEDLTGRQKRLNKRKKATKETDDRRFQTKNIFDSLRDMSLDPSESASSPSSPEVEFEDVEETWTVPAPCATEAEGGWENEIFVQDKTGWVPIEQSERHAMELMPKFEDGVFWGEFGNTLRVFGTEEGVVRIAEWEGGK
jgi:poly(A)-specific ribonuclease